MGEGDYCLYVVCKNCSYEIPFKKIPPPTPENPPMAPQSATLMCPSCEHEAAYMGGDMQVGLMDLDE